MRKVCVVITARPSYSRIRSLLYAIKSSDKLELQLVVAASALLDRYGNVEKVIEQEGFSIDRRVYMIIEGETCLTSAKSTGLGITELASVFDDLKPDVIVTVADRFETMATAIAASYMNIPLVHVQGGEVTGSIDEKVRHSITKLADIHCVSTELSAKRVKLMGENPDKIYVTGCPSIDLAMETCNKGRDKLESIFRTFSGVGDNIDFNKDYIIVMQHPVTTEHQQSRQHIENTLNAVYQTGLQTLWLWPNVDAGSDGTSEGIRAFREKMSLPHIYFLKNIPPEDFILVLTYSKCIVGNSSVAIREGSFLGVPAVNIGNRQNGRERGKNVVDVAYDTAEIAAAIESQSRAEKFDPDYLYGNGHAGEQIADVIATAELSTTKVLAY